MTLEVEQKYRVDDSRELTKRIEQMGGLPTERIKQSDRYFAHPARDFKQTDEALRIRTVEDESFITYKGPKRQAAVKMRREIELPLGSRDAGAQFAELLEALGFRPVATVPKERVQFNVPWRERTVVVALDDVGATGQFCEIEVCVETEEADLAAELVSSLAARLGLNEIERRSYLAMVLKDE